MQVSFYFFFPSKRATLWYILSIFTQILFLVCSKEEKELDSNKLKSFAKNILLLFQKVGAKAPQRRRTFKQTFYLIYNNFYLIRHVLKKFG